MLRVGQKRRRTTGEIKQQKEEARLKQADIEAKLQQFEELKQNQSDLQQEAQRHQQSSAILHDLQSKGKIRVSSGGEVLVPGIDEIPDDFANPNNY